MSMILIVHLVYKALRDFPDCVHSLWETYWASRHGSSQVYTAGVQKFCWQQSVHCRVVHCNEGLSDWYT